MAEKKKAWLYLKARTDEDLKAQKSLLLEYADKPAVCLAGRQYHQRSGGSEDRRAAPGGNRSGRHISASIVVAFEYSFSEKVRVLCVAEQR